MSHSSSLTRRSAAVSSMQPFCNDSILPRGGDAVSDSSLPHAYKPGSGRHRKDNDNGSSSPFSFWRTNLIMAALPNWTGFCVKTLLGMTVALYLLNQKHMLPKPLSAVVSKTLFWPTLPITAARRIGTWSTVVDDTVIMGGAPFGFAGLPERLYKEFGVRGIINMCKEYRGPTKEYERLGMKELWLPTVDHFEPTVKDYKSAVSFIEAHKARGDRVYVHCRAGHGRSAAAVFAYLLNEDPDVDPMQLNADLCQLRNVRKTLWRQPNIKRFHSWLKSGGKIGNTGLPHQNEELELTLRGDSDSDLE